MPSFRVTAVIAAATALLAIGTAAWADVTVSVPAPTGRPAAGNDYNVTIVYGGSPGDLITFSSSSAIAGISLDPGARAENPYQTNNGNSNVDVKVDRPGANGITKGVIRYKDGTRRAVLIFTGAKSVTVTDQKWNMAAGLDIYYTAEWSDPNKATTKGVTDIPGWGVGPAQAPAPATPGHSEDKGE